MDTNSTAEVTPDTPTSGNKFFSVENLKVAYGQSTVISDLSFNIKKGEIIAIVGRNGMGKTTLMRSLIGMVPIASGKVSVDGVALENLKNFQRVEKGLGFVPQGRMIFGTMTVKENILTGLKVSKRKKIPEFIYEMFPVLEEMKSRRGGNLSGGQQQQLAIARALATDPQVLLLDEPTEGIQPSIIKELAQTLKQIRDQFGLTIFVSEQVLSFAIEIADRIFVIERGDIVHEELKETVDEAKIASYLSV